MKRQERLDRIRAVEREYLAAQAALGLLGDALRADPSFLRTAGLRPADARNLSENLEATYLVRMFAEFEAGLRDAWKNYFRRRSAVRTRDLLDRIAALRAVPTDYLDNPHAVRRYRNALVHEEAESAEPIPVARARSYLGSFFSRLPLDW